jgi:hypothetical protein
MKRIHILTGALAAGLLASVGVAQAATITVIVPGDSNPNLAGQPDGTSCCDTPPAGDVAPAQSPVLVPGGVTGGEVFRFAATGSTDGAGAGPTGPDGAYIFNMADYGLGVAPANNVGVLGLIGVFLDNATPSGATEPAPLDFSGGLNFASLSPGLAQMFWIGDGLTGTGSGAVQTFIAPTGATRLFLGTIDGFQWSNNTGAYTVEVTSGVPEPVTWTMLLLGCAATGAALRRRRAAIAIA